MSAEPSNDSTVRQDVPQPRGDLSPRARTVGVVAWCSFLAAAAATMVLFAFLDPAALPRGTVPSWWTGRHAVYAVGFFFCWALAAGASALTIYMAHTEHTDGPRKS